MGLITRLRDWWEPTPARSTVIPPWPNGVDNYWPFANLGGQAYPLLNLTMPGSREETIENSFQSYVTQAYKGNAIVFACMAARLMLFTEARFQYQRMVKGRPGDLFGDASLGILEEPWPGGVTSDLLNLALADVDLSGNFYATRRGNRIVRMEPDWVDLISGSHNDPSVTADDLDAEFLGIVYYPGGKYSGGTPEFIQRGQVAHFKLLPDPTAHLRGMSWLTPILREIQADGAATSHKLAFFQNGATPQMIVRREDAPSKDSFDQWRAMIESGHTGAANAYKTLYLTAGADATVVGKDLQQLEFKATQGAGETRIAAAARIHPAVVGLSEGMQGASLNAGNFAAARRLVADGFARPAWRNFAGSMQTLVPPPAGCRLWYDDRDISFLREDRKDAAEIAYTKAQTIRQYTDAGFTAKSAVACVTAENESLLVHSGLFSVQLQPPGTKAAPTVTAPTNGTKPKASAQETPA